MSAKKDDDAWAVGCLILIAAASASIGIGYIFGAGYGWLSFAAFMLIAVIRHHLRKDRARPAA